jgi:general secretion pathway protein D
MKLIMLCLSGLMLAGVASFAEETYTSLSRTSDGKAGETFPPGLFKFTDSDLTQVLDIYRDLSGRTIVRSTALPIAKINLETKNALTRIEALQALDSVLAQNGIIMIPQGTKFVKAVPKQAAAHECPPVVDLPGEQLPDCGTYITYLVEVKHQKPRDLAQGLQPFASLPNSILGIDNARLIVLRDFSSNVRRMLEILERIDKPSSPEKAEPKRKAAKRTAGKASRGRAANP